MRVKVGKKPLSNDMLQIYSDDERFQFAWPNFLSTRQDLYINLKALKQWCNGFLGEEMTFEIEDFD